MNKSGQVEKINSNSYFNISVFIIPFIFTILLLVANVYSFLLFHVLAELFAITIAILMSVVAWQMYPFTRNDFLMYLGCGYFWIGLLDLLHTLTYKGMHIFPELGSNTAIQFWIGTRYLEAILLLTAPWYLNHSLKRINIFFAYGAFAVIIAMSVKFDIFPEGFIEGKGLTAFKIYSEYMIIALLGGAIYYMNRNKKLLDGKIINVMIVSIVLTMCAELAFTFYVDLYGVSNLIGHIFKLFSFWLIFMAIIRTTLEEPFRVMSRGATTYDAIPDATIVVDENGVIRQANEKASRLSNNTKQEIVGKNNHKLFHPKDLNIEDCPVCQAIVNNEVVNSVELEIDGIGTWYDYSLSHIQGAAKLDGTVEVIRDITERKNSEEKLRELDALKNSIVENLPSMLFVKDANDHRYVEWNKAAEDLTGILKSEMLGNSDYNFWPKEQAQFFINKDKEVINGGKLLNIEQEQLATKYKGNRTLHTKKIPIYDLKGQAKYILGISDDITDKLKTEEILNRSQKMDAVGQMSGGIAHDFNNQLGVILGYAELLSQQSLNESQLKWISAVQAAANRCAELTEQLLIFSRKGEVDKEVINVNKTIAEMEVMIQGSLTPAVKVNYFINESVWKTEVNLGGFQDAILNLILNARDAMPEGGTLIIETSNILLHKNETFTLPNNSTGEYIEIMISDNGSGMDQETFEHVFEPFYTTKDVGKGTGLGLSMVYGFVRRYGGDILLESKPNEGATFRIYLPRAKDASSTIQKDLEKEFIAAKGHESILVVDDEVLLLTYVEQILKTWGYEVFCAKNAADALVILENNHIDLLFSDVVMPGGISGYDLAKKARENYPEIKVLITSGFADKVENSEKDMFELISKPYESKDLSKALRRILEE